MIVDLRVLILGYFSCRYIRPVFDQVSDYVRCKIFATRLFSLILQNIFTGRIDGKSWSIATNGSNISDVQTVAFD